MNKYVQFKPLLTIFRSQKKSLIQTIKKSEMDDAIILKGYLASTCMDVRSHKILINVWMLLRVSKDLQQDDFKQSKI